MVQIRAILDTNDTKPCWELNLLWRRAMQCTMLQCTSDNTSIVQTVVIGSAFGCSALLQRRGEWGVHAETSKTAMQNAPPPKKKAER